MTTSETDHLHSAIANINRYNFSVPNIARVVQLTQDMGFVEPSLIECVAYLMRYAALLERELMDYPSEDRTFKEAITHIRETMYEAP